MSQNASVTLQIPEYFQSPMLVKVSPDHGAYAFSFKQSQILVFNTDGTLSRKISLLDNRPLDIQYHFFDYQVDTRGGIHVLAVWRELPRQTSSGVFIYDKEGKFIKVLVFDKHVDGRGILLDSKDNYIILGLNSDYYFGRTRQLFLLHRYGQAGEYLGSFFEINPADFGSPDVSGPKVYSQLRPLVDHLPVGRSAQRGVYAVIPGTHSIQFFDLAGFRASETVHLQSPLMEKSVAPSPVRSATPLGEDLQITAVQIDADSITAEFDNMSRFDKPRAQVHRRIRVNYDPQNGTARSVVPIDPETGVLIQQAGTPSERAFYYSPGKRQIKEGKSPY